MDVIQYTFSVSGTYWTVCSLFRSVYPSRKRGISGKVEELEDRAGLENFVGRKLPRMLSIRCKITADVSTHIVYTPRSCAIFDARANYTAIS